MNENIENVVAPENTPILNDILPEPKKFDISGKDSIFACILLAVSVITSAFGIWGGFKAGFTASLLLLLFFITAYLLPARTKIKAFPIFCMVLSIGVSLSFTLTTNSAVRFWSLVSVGLLDLVWFVSLSGEREEKGDLGIFKNIFMPVFMGGIGNIPVSLRSLLSGNEKGNKRLGKAIAGIALAFPVLLVVVPLLMSSDEAFSGMIEMLFGDLALTVLKLVLGIIISIFVISYSLSLKKEEPKEQESKQSFSGIENTILISFLSVISVCYLAYLFSQLAYFFSAFSGFLPEDYEFTVSAYARRGFFEMTVIAAINFGIIFFNTLLSRKKDGKSCVTLRIICTFIGLFTLIIIATAISKMVLYISSFGMTRLRIQTTAFMIFLSVVFISLIIRQYAPKVRVMRVAFIMSAVVLIALGTANVNTIVAKYNYEAYKSETLEEIDVHAIYELGAEGIPYLIKLTEDDNSDTAESAKEYLHEILDFGDYGTFIIEEDGSYNFEFNEDSKPMLEKYSLPESIAYKELTEYVKNNSAEIAEQHEKSGLDYPEQYYTY